MSSVATADRRGPTLVIGLGNPILGDDGIGWHVVDALEARLAAMAEAGDRCPDVAIDRLAVGGLSLMERLVGCERAILVDALLDDAAPGTVVCRPLAEVVSRLAGHLDSAHDVALPTAISAGRALGAALPSDVTVVGISVRVADEFDERLSPLVAAAVEPAVDMVMEILARERLGAA